MDWLDYGARMYDPAVGRFVSVDALADHPDQIDKSVYAYTWNNPILLTDPDGNCPKCFLKGIWRGVKNTASGVAHVVTHPIETLEAVGNAVLHPIETGGAIIDAVSERIDEAANTEGGYYELAGEIVFEVGTAVVAATKVSKVGKAGKTGKWDGPVDYSDLTDSKSVGPGKKFTAKQKKEILKRNKEQNGGVLRSDRDGSKLNKPVQSKKGVRADMNQAEVDHKKARAKGGSNSSKNAQLLSKKQNIKKSDN